MNPVLPRTGVILLDMWTTTAACSEMEKDQPFEISESWRNYTKTIFFTLIKRDP
jgi:hypothetical protein